MDTGNIKEKRIKREIANSNERRRMQSINAGFQKLKRLLPVNDGEKISKANILQHAADFITTIERDRIALYEQNTHIKRCLLDIKAGKLDVGTAFDTIEAAIANKALPTIPLNPHVTASSSASSTPASTPTPTPSIGSLSLSASAANSIITSAPNSRQIKSTTIKTNNVDNNNHPMRTTRKYQRRQPIKSRNTNTSAPIGKRNAGKRKYNDIITNNNMNIINNNVNTINNNNNTTVIVTMSNNVSVSDNSQNIGSVAEIISDKITSPKNGPTAQGGGIAKAAIALPLEVPYTSETITKSHHHHSNLDHQHDRELDIPEDMIISRNLVKSETLAPTVSARTNSTTSPLMDPHEPASKGQTLDTICKAIMEIEGDRVFNSEKIDQLATRVVERAP